jgi:CRP-like cAMP-binding protein
MSAFRNFIESYVRLPDEEWEAIADVLTPVEYKKNEIILQAGEVCRFFGFLEKGLLRYFVEHDGNEVTKFFTVAPYCFTSAYSFRNQVPATESIQALEHSMVYTISLKNADLLLELKHWAAFTRKFTQEVQYQTEQLMMEAKTTPATERYRLLMENHPGIIQRIPLKHLSGFLGIAPQSLSRIRKNYIRGLRK